MSLWNYGKLLQFRHERIGKLVITFDELKKERYFDDNEGQKHCWIAHKDKKDYALLKEDVEDLPIKILDTKIINDNKAIFHFVSRCAKIGFKANKQYEFRDLIDNFFNVVHSNPRHFTLLKIIAFASYISRINIRVCSNMELGKDGTFEVLNYLTNKIKIASKPDTKAKFDFIIQCASPEGVAVLNELIPKNAEQKYAFTDCLLELGSLKNNYEKGSRGSASWGSKDTINVHNVSLVIFYNRLEDVAENDKINYFDFIYGRQVLERFLPIKLNGKIDVSQFKEKGDLSVDEDKELLGIARSIEWWKQNYKAYLRPFKINISNLNLSERQEHSFKVICDFLGLYANDDKELQEWINLLIQCHYDYKAMISQNSLLDSYNRADVSLITEKEQELKIEVEDVLSPLKFLDANDGKASIDVFMEKFGEKELNKLKLRGDVFMPNPNEVHILR